MKGRKPKPENLGNLARHPAAVDAQRIREQHASQAERTATQLRPRGLGAAAIRVWDRLAPELILLGRLKPHYVDALAEYCRIVARLAAWRQKLDDDEWTYVISGRNGMQRKSRPEVAQLNDDWRKWRSLAASFGLTPADERAVTSNQGDLFDDGWSDV